MLSNSLFVKFFLVSLRLVQAYGTPPAIDLVPLPQHIQKRYDPDALNLRNQETFLYGQDGTDDVQANFTVQMPRDFENILNMERFDKILKSIKCDKGSGSMVLAFDDADGFSYAQKVWGWVNGADDHAFVMVAGKGDCEWNDDRVPFLVSKITYDTAGKIATLKAAEKDWSDVAHTYDLYVGHVQKPGVVQRRAIGGELDIAIDHKFAPPIFKLKEDQVTLSLDTKGSVSGHVVFEFHASASILHPDISVTFKAVPRGLSAEATVKVGLEVELTEKLDKYLPPIEIPLTPYNLKTLGKFTPTLDITTGVALKKVTAKVTVGQTYKAVVPDSSYLEVDVFAADTVKKSGWVPQITKSPMSMEGKFGARGMLYVRVGLMLKAEILRQGLEVGLELKPYRDITVDFIESPTGICENPDSGKCDSGTNAKCNRDHVTAVQLASKQGADLDIKGNKVGPKSGLLFSVTLAHEEDPTILANCFLFGPTLSNDPSATSATSTPKQSSASIISIKSSTAAQPGPTGVKHCKLDNGIGGECRSTSSCSSAGGTYRSGFCPDQPDDIKCCTYGSCEFMQGGASVTGNCTTTDLCSGTSTPGHCKGGEAIQCCTLTKRDWGSCVVGGKTGSCVARGVCLADAGAQWTAGGCGGAPSDIQCCTHA